MRLAACELWKRWRPEPASQEMVHDLVLRLKASAEQGDPAAATRYGIQVWGALRPLLTPGMKTTVAVETLLGRGSEGLIYDWAADFSMAALRASADDPEVSRQAAAVMAEVMAQFSDEPEGWSRPPIQDRVKDAKTWDLPAQMKHLRDLLAAT